MIITAAIIGIVGTLSALVLAHSNTWKKLIIGFIGIFITIGLFIGIFIIHHHNIIGDNIHVATIGGKSIYYDESSDEYFVLRTNDWNPFKIFYTEYLDREEAEKIIDVAKIVNEWN